MTWNDYCMCIVPLIKKYGRHGMYTDEKVKKGFETWRNRPKQDLLDEVNISITTNIMIELYEPVVQSKRPERTIYQHEDLKITDGHLERLLALHNCKSLMDLVHKLKK